MPRGEGLRKGGWASGGKFYAGAQFVVRGHAYRETPWEEFHQIVNDLMASSAPLAFPRRGLAGARRVWCPYEPDIMGGSLLR